MSNIVDTATASEGLLNDIPKLTQVLTVHVVPGEFLAADVVKLTSAKTVPGQNVTTAAQDGVRINGAMVITPNIDADNGVIHAIDRVILPQ